jgi:DNA-binding NtrC family response regulator
MINKFANQEEKTILIIEDERALSRVAQDKLEKSGFNVATARTSEQALGYMEDMKKVDVIWLDHYLVGKESGLDFLIKIRKNKKWNKIPVFVVSNTASPDKVVTYEKLGAIKYFIKSDYRLDEIIKEIKKCLKV